MRLSQTVEQLESKLTLEAVVSQFIFSADEEKIEKEGFIKRRLKQDIARAGEEKTKA